MPRSSFVGMAGCLVVALFGITPCAGATEPFTRNPPAIESPEASVDPRTVEIFLDGIMAAQMETYPILGAVVSVVQDDDVVLTKGYGFRNAAKTEIIDPHRHLVSIASITKLFTWTAVMQLVEKGLLDLNVDINTYLDFPIPATYDTPITVAHLMTHTAGFEDRPMDTKNQIGRPVPALREWLAAHVPARIRPPGMISAYSNYGAALAGYIVARTAGKSYESYIEDAILRPLGMTHTACRQPLQDEFSALLAPSHAGWGLRMRPLPYRTMPDGPSGAVYSTAADMGRFMLAHLKAARLGQSPLLGQATAQKMHQTLFRHAPEIAGWAHGFEELPGPPGVRIIGHGGSFNGYCSELALVPDRDLGIFVAYTTEYGSSARCQLLRAFLDRFVAQSPRPRLDPAPSGFADRSAVLRGFYRSARRTRTTIEKASELIQPPLKLTVRDDGISFNYADWQEAAPFIFRWVDGDGMLTFRRDDAGRITHAFINAWAYEKLQWFEMPSFHRFLMGICGVLLVTATFGWPLAAIAAKRRGRTHQNSGRLERAAWLVGWLSAALSLVLLAALAVVLSGNTEELAYGIPGRLRILLLVPYAMIGLLPLALAATVLAWIKGYWRCAARVSHSVIVLVSGIVLWFLNYWNLIGWRF